MRELLDILRILTLSRYLVSLGALLVILSLAFDAFAQQVLSSEIRIIATPWYDGGNGSQPDPGSIIPRAVSYRNVIDPNVQGSGHDFTSTFMPKFLCKPNAISRS